MNGLTIPMQNAQNQADCQGAERRLRLSKNKRGISSSETQLKICSVRANSSGVRANPTRAAAAKTQTLMPGFLMKTPDGIPLQSHGLPLAPSSCETV